MSRLKDILSKMEKSEVERIALEARTTVEYLTEQLANGHRKAGFKLARRLVNASRGRLTLPDVREDVFGEANEVSV